MKEVLKDIQSGKFTKADGWMNINQVKKTSLK
jgi:ketol-acid reductoisomerase